MFYHPIYGEQVNLLRILKHAVLFQNEKLRFLSWNFYSIRAIYPIQLYNNLVIQVQLLHANWYQYGISRIN